MTAAVAPAGSSVADRVVALHARLARLARGPGLAPTTAVNDAFRELVGLCGSGLDEEAAAAVEDRRVGAIAADLHRLCAAGEYELERTWSRRVAGAPDPTAELAAFPYLGNYEALTSLELHTVAGLRPGTGPSRLCVLGSGPLPLTALLMARALGATVDAVDVDADATALAGAVLRRLPGGELVRPCRADARQFAGVDRADLVVLAALVGLEPAAKRAVLGAVAGRMRPGTVLVVRGAHRLRTLLYPPVVPQDLLAAGAGRLRLLAEVHPLHEVVNSLLVAVRT